MTEVNEEQEREARETLKEKAINEILKASNVKPSQDEYEACGLLIIRILDELIQETKKEAYEEGHSEGYEEAVEDLT